MKGVLNIFLGLNSSCRRIGGLCGERLKRCLALGGAKNHLLVLPDAQPEMTAQNVAASMSGCAGQRCMAASAMVAVGDVDGIIAQIFSLDFEQAENGITKACQVFVKQASQPDFFNLHM